jgi:O-antigen ligase
MILSVYPEYRWSEAPNPQTPHLHNNPLQIAAERGLPGLAWWLWLVAAVMADAYRESRRADRVREWSAVATLAILTGVLVSGLFEYNFGDSEILMFTLLVSAIPYALRRQRGERPDAATGSA